MNSNNPYETPVHVTDAVIPASTSIKTTLFSFQGRIPRRTYWMWYLISVAVAVVVISLMSALIGAPEPVSTEDGSAVSGGMPVIGSIFMFIIVIFMSWIGLALQVKRWHDRDKSGWWVLIGLIPIVGPIWVLVEVGCLRGTVGPNNYGEDPT